MFASLKRILVSTLRPDWLGRLRAWNIRRLIRQFPKRVVEHSYGDVRLKLCLTDPLAAGWYDHDWAPLPEIAVLRESKLRVGARVFDLGAHQGVVAAMLAKEVGLSGQVVAVEASAHNCAAALENKRLNDLSQIEVVHAAVSDREGTVIFNEGLTGRLDDGSGEWGRTAVDAVTIDVLADRFGCPNVVMMDVEGAECLALAGGPRVLASGTDFIVEVHVGCGLEKLGGSVEQLLSYFPANEYARCVRAEDDRSFRDLLLDDPITANRFFLLALRR